MFKLSKLLIALAALSLLVSCSSKHEPTEPMGISYKANEVLVRQCQDISNLEFKQLLEKHEVTIKKQMSPHLYIVSWDDEDRHADEVVQELKGTSMMCGVEKYQKK